MVAYCYFILLYGNIFAPPVFDSNFFSAYRDSGILSLYGGILLLTLLRRFFDSNFLAVSDLSSRRQTACEGQR
jgi:hypothetical protein